MTHKPIDPHNIPLEELFPTLKPERRDEMRDFLDGYAEVAWQVWERMEHEWASNTAHELKDNSL